jgi:DNA-binding transcriptional ArsR family regulator
VSPKNVKSDPVATVPSWTFLSNHAHILLLITRDPELTIREIAERVGITERAVQRILGDLEEAQYLERMRLGRRNFYKVNPNLPLRHPIEAHQEVGALIALATPPDFPSESNASLPDVVVQRGSSTVAGSELPSSPGDFYPSASDDAECFLKPAQSPTPSDESVFSSPPSSRER